jgi:hypothetical protein
VYTKSVARGASEGQRSRGTRRRNDHLRGASVGDKSPKAAEKKKKQSAAKKDATAKKK